MKRVLYLGWLGFNNVGDELMWELFRGHARKHWGSGYDIIPSLPDAACERVHQYDAVVLGGGSLLIPHYIELLHLAVKAGKPVWVWGSGYDGMEKAPAPVLSVYGARTRRQLVDIANHAAFFGVRGPLTYQALADAGIPMGRIRVTGDPGMLLRLQAPKPHPEKEHIIGINWGTALGKVYGGDELRVEHALTAAAKEWIRQGCRISIYSVWDRDREPCRRLAEKINDRKHVQVEDRILPANQLMRNISKCRFTVNFKLHANIMSHAAGVPFICLGYRLKCFDYVHSVDLPEAIVPMDSPALLPDLLQKADQTVSSRSILLNKMARSHMRAREQFVRLFRGKPVC